MEGKKITLDSMYDNYLEKVKLSKETMTIIQAVETKRAFCAGVGTLIYVINQSHKFSDKHFDKMFGGIVNEVSEFWKEQIK